MTCLSFSTPSGCTDGNGAGSRRLFQAPVHEQHEGKKPAVHGRSRVEAGGRVRSFNGCLPRLVHADPQLLITLDSITRKNNWFPTQTPAKAIRGSKHTAITRYQHFEDCSGTNMHQQATLGEKQMSIKATFCCKSNGGKIKQLNYWLSQLAGILESKWPWKLTTV